MNKRSFIKSILLLAAAPTLFIPKVESVRWKLPKGNLTTDQLEKWADDMDFEARQYFGKWQFVTESLVIPRAIGNSLHTIRFKSA